MYYLYYRNKGFKTQIQYWKKNSEIIDCWLQGIDKIGIQSLNMRCICTAFSARQDKLLSQPRNLLLFLVLINLIFKDTIHILSTLNTYITKIFKSDYLWWDIKNLDFLGGIFSYFCFINNEPFSQLMWRDSNSYIWWIN